MENLLPYYCAGAALIAWTIVVTITPLFMRVALYLKLVDNPDGKLKQHKVPTPYLGGVAVYCGLLVALMLFLPHLGTIFYMIFGVTLLLLTGLIDDSISLTPRQKFIGQLAAALSFIKGGLYLRETFLFSYTQATSSIFWMGISLLWILSIVNAFNLIDVMDGLAVTVALNSSLAFLFCALAAGNYATVVVIAALIGALSAFLIYNVPPARMYLGDAGSLCIGGVLSVIPFMITWSAFSPLGFLAPPIILAIPLLEGTTLIIVRMIKGIPFYNGSRDHFCHYLMDQGWSKKTVLLYVIVVNIFLFGLTYLYLTEAISFPGLVVLATLFILTWYSVLFYKLFWTPKAS